MSNNDWRANALEQRARAEVLRAGKGARSGFELRRARVELMRKAPERRQIDTGPFELRERVQGAGAGMLAFRGWAAEFDRDYTVGDFTERIRPGAFARCLNERSGAGPDVVLNIDHGRSGSGLPLARTTAGTLRLTEDKRGLRVDADLDPDDPDTAMLAIKLRNQAVGAMSFAFRCFRDVWNEDLTRRELLEVSVHQGDCSIVTYAANPATEAAIRSRTTVGARRSPLVDKRLRAARQARQEAAIRRLRKGEGR